ncbi:MAG: FtsQ-type POTRA domain-containing protein [Pseudomonadota bacterium]
MQGIYQKSRKKKGNPVKKLIGWTVLTLLAFGLFKGCMYTAGVVGGLSVFNIKEIVVDAPENIKPAEIVTLSGIKKGDGLFKISTREAKKKLLTHPWVKEVRIRRIPMSTIKIRIKSKEVAALGKSDGGLVYIDEYGKIIGKLVPGYKTDCVIINSKPESYPKLVAALSEIKPYMNVSELTLEENVITVYLSDDATKYKLNLDDVNKSIKLIQRVAYDIKQRGEMATIIDATLPANNVVVKGLRKVN